MRVNVIGHITSEIGLGVMACDLMQALIDLGHEVAGYDVDPGLGRQGRDRRMARYVRREGELYRDGVDVAVFPINVAAHWGKTYRFGRRHVAVPLWELDQVNDRWIGDLRRWFDGVVSSSDFIHETLRKSGARVWRGKHPHFGATDGQRINGYGCRAAFGLPEDRVIFTFAFDPSSDLQRKNPMAVVKAFRMAAAPNARLVIQINASADRKPELDRWLASVRGLSQVCVLEEHLSHADEMKLIASSDMYISLHRAEGLGLGMLEAMLLGVPVIATGWSGNLSYMDRENAALVDYRLVPLRGQIPAYSQAVIGKPAKWAEPDVRQAARLIRELAGDAEKRAKLGRLGQARAEQYQTEARKLDWIAEITQSDQAQSGKVVPTRQAQPGQAQPGKVVPTGLMIFTPTWVENGRDAILPVCREMIQAQRIECPWTWMVGRENPYPIGDHRNVLHQYQRARELFLAGGYEALLTVEHDCVLPDPGAVQRMLDTPGAVIYAPYVLRHGKPMLSTWQWINRRNLGMSLTNYPRELARARARIVHRISGAGMGCTLFRRAALEAIAFEASGGRNPCPDLGFAEAALRAGFESFGRFDVPVAHWNGERLLYPFEEMVMKKYLARETLNAALSGRFVHLVAGHEIELSEEEAAEAQRMGYIAAEIAPVAPPVADVILPDQPVEVVTPTARRRARKA